MAAAANVAAAEVQKANQLIYDQLAALETFTGDSDAWHDWQNNFRRLTREFDNDLFEVSSFPSDVWRPG
jgi:hypothetical protein